MYQLVIQQSFKVCEDVANISDDVIIYGKTTEEQDRRLQRVSERQKEKNLTLNAERCKFHMTQIVFIGLMLRDNGIGPAEDKVKTIVDAREPQCMRKQKLSGTGKLQCSFHPRLRYNRGAIAKINQKRVRLEFGEEQKNAFNELKRVCNPLKCIIQMIIINGNGK